MRKGSLLFIMAVLILTLAACSNASTEEETAVQRIKLTCKLVLCTK